MILRTGEDLISRYASKYDKATDAILVANSIGLIPPPDDEDPTGDLATGLDKIDILAQILSQKGLLVKNNHVIDPKPFFLKKRVIGLYFSAEWYIHLLSTN